MCNKIIRKSVFLLFFITCFGFSQKIKVACIGNSVTFGAGIKDRNVNSFPVQLQQMLGDNYEVANFGYSGGFGDCTLAWNIFTTIDHWKGYLLIYHAGKGTTPISVSVAEIGQEDFDRVLAAVKTKIADIKNEVQ